MIRWLEANGYNVSYTTGVDTDRRGNLLTNHKVFLSVGHDEYWSGAQRANVEAARNAGVHLAFFAGNDIYWKTRWETRSMDRDSLPHAGLLQGDVGQRKDRSQSRMDRDVARSTLQSATRRAVRPENTLTGTLFTVNVEPRMDSIAVPASYGTHRFWRNTSVATLPSGQSRRLRSWHAGLRVE